MRFFIPDRDLETMTRHAARDVRRAFFIRFALGYAALLAFGVSVLFTM